MWIHQNGSGSHRDVQTSLLRNSNGYFVEGYPYINSASTSENTNYFYQSGALEEIISFSRWITLVIHQGCMSLLCRESVHEAS